MEVGEAGKGSCVQSELFPPHYSASFSRLGWGVSGKCTSKACPSIQKRGARRRGGGESSVKGYYYICKASKGGWGGGWGLLAATAN